MLDSNQVQPVISSVVTPVALEGFKTPLLNEYPGASAAYSLRRLKSWDDGGRVVRVRRASDNSEKDFSAADVSSGAMTQWVNGQVVPPLDVRELVDGERTGDLVEAAAAYSLRNLSASYTGNVVDVRRSSDDAEDSFTAAEVADGTLTTWVGAGNDGFVTQWYDQSGNANHATQGTDASQPKIVDGGSLVTGGLDFDGVDDFLEVTPISTASTALSTFIFGDAQSNVFSYPIGTTNNAGIGVSDTSFRYNLISGTPILEDWSSTLGGKNIYTFIHDGTTSVPNVSGYRNGAIGSQTSAEQGAAPSDNIRYIGTRNQVQDFNGEIAEIIIYPSDQSDNRTAIEANIGDTYNIDLPSGVDTGYDQVDGFVETWYDQSGNGNDAVQQVSGKQPKIVDAGVLVSEGGKPAFNVDGVDDVLELGSAITNVGDFYVSLVSVMEETSGLQAILGADTNTDYLRAKDSTWLLYTGTGAGDTGNVGWSAPFDSRYLMSFNRSGSTVTAQLNGSSAGTGTNGTDIGFITKLFQRGSNTTQLWKGNVQELIIYPSDQSANRVAIETNINNQYDIY